MSVIDYPGHIAVVLFLGGCDFRCPNCQNPSLIKVDANSPRADMGHLWAMLEERRDWVDGVAITGGEPMLNKDLPELAAEIHRRTELKVKIDTNGHHPDLLQQLLDDGNTDYVAMDIKAAPARYSEAAGKLVDLDRIMRSIELLKNGKTAYEFRTTVVPGIVDEAAIDEMGKMIKGARLWAFQQYQNRQVLDPAFRDRKPLPPDEFRKLVLRAAPFVEETVTRGI